MKDFRWSSSETDSWGCKLLSTLGDKGIPAVGEDGNALAFFRFTDKATELTTENSPTMVGLTELTWYTDWSMRVHFGAEFINSC